MRVFRNSDNSIIESLDCKITKNIPPIVLTDGIFLHLEGFQGVINLLIVEAIKVYLRHTLRTMPHNLTDYCGGNSGTFHHCCLTVACHIGCQCDRNA